MGIFKPEVGDTVGFWNDEAELWELGTVLAYGADRRLYFIQPDDENMPECLIGYTGIRPVSEQRTKGRMSALEFELDYWKNRAEVTHLQHVAANKRADDAEARIEELEDQNRRLKTVLNLTNDDVTHYRQHSAKLHADLIEARKIAGDCEARAEKAEAELYRFHNEAADLAAESLADMTRTAAEDGTADQVDEFPESTRVPKAIIDGCGDRWELNHDTGEYEFSDLSEHLDYIDRRWTIKERIY